jgi:TetR/AcrR family transcriptional regulator, cholesterol catabolism regulator
MPTKTTEESTEVRLRREAARLFRKQGYARTSTRELAAAVGLQSASLYHYMSNKEDLLRSIIKQGYDLMISSLRAAVDISEQENPARTLEYAIQSHLRTALENRDIYLTTLAEVKSLGPRSRREVDQKRAEYWNLMASVIENAQSSGHLRSDIPTEHLMLVLRNQLSWTIFWFNEDGELTIDEFAALANRIFVEGAGA